MPTAMPPDLKTRRIMAGWYRVTRGTVMYKVQRYDDGLWGVYHEGDCVWVDSRLKDCKAWIAGTHRDI